MSTFDLSISFPAPGRIVLRSRVLFGNAEDPLCRRFLKRVFEVAQVSHVTVCERGTPRAELCYCAQTTTLDEVAARIVGALRRSSDRSGQPESNGHAGAAPSPISAAWIARDRRGQVRYYRHDSIVTSWEVIRERPGQLRVRNRALALRARLGRTVARNLRGVAGIERVRQSPFSTVLNIKYDPAHFSKAEVLARLESVLATARPSESRGRLDLHLPICTASLPVAAAAQFAIPPLVPVAAAILACTAIPTLQRAGRTLTRERRLGVDALDALVVLGCLGTLSVFAGATLTWCLSVRRVLAERTQGKSKRFLLSACGELPRSAWLYRDGSEVEVAVERIRRGDIVAVAAGELIPVDGHVVDGLAMIDQQVLTGESTAVEKGVGDRVFASSLAIAGKVYISVESAGRDTVSAQARALLDAATSHKPPAQQRAEGLADRAVVPALAVGALAAVAAGPAGGLAVLKSNLGTGMATASSFALLGALARCAHAGIVVRDMQALDEFNQVDTLVLDRSATLNYGELEVGRIVTTGEFSPELVLWFAAAAESKFHHPIARAIRDKALALDLDLPHVEETEYSVGRGISARVGDHAVRVGNLRYAAGRTAEVPDAIGEALGIAARARHLNVAVAINDRLAGAIELQARPRPELQQVIASLRKRGMETLVVVGCRATTEASGLVVVLEPDEVASFVEQRRHNGHRVAYVGAGHPPTSVDVSIAIGDGSRLSTETAQVVVLGGDLSRLRELHDLARDLFRDTRHCWSLIVAPNVACIAGVFTFGLGVMASVVANNLAALAALANGVRPLRRFARIEAERRHRRDVIQVHAQLGGTRRPDSEGHTDDVETPGGSHRTHCNSRRCASSLID